MNQLPIAMQVYSVRQEVGQDFAGVMKQIREMGYDGVELAGLYGLSAETVRDILKENKLTAVSAHVPYEELTADLEGTLDCYEVIGCKYLAIPYLTEEKRYGGNQYNDVIAAIRTAAAACKSRGMTLSYHNHDFEFKKTEQGAYVLDELLASFSPEELCLEPDTAWIKYAGVDPLDYLEQYKDRCPTVHIKDFRRTSEGLDLVAVGEGEQASAALIQKAAECGAKWLIVEQDDHPYGSPMGNMKKSIDFIRGLK